MDITCVTIDCTDPTRVAQFWSAALRWTDVDLAADGSYAICKLHVADGGPVA